VIEYTYRRGHLPRIHTVSAALQAQGMVEERKQMSPRKSVKAQPELDVTEATPVEAAPETAVNEQEQGAPQAGAEVNDVTMQITTLPAQTNGAPTARVAPLELERRIEMEAREHLAQALEELRKPFHPSQVTFKPGAIAKSGDRALALAYGDLRAYQNRLDEVCGGDWSVSYTPWGDRIICNLTIFGVTRSSTGEPDNDSERNEIAGTVAEAQAFKRACAMFGLGRYLYTLPSMWAEYDKERRQFSEPAKAKLLGVITQHYRRSAGPKQEMAELFPEGPERPQEDEGDLTPLRRQFDELGHDLYGDQWDAVCRRNVQRISGGEARTSGELSAEQIRKLIEGMRKLQRQREMA
jgi:hypothetical protein